MHEIALMNYSMVSKMIFFAQNNSEIQFDINIYRIQSFLQTSTNTMIILCILEIKLVVSGNMIMNKNSSSLRMFIFYSEYLNYG